MSASRDACQHCITRLSTVYHWLMESLSIYTSIYPPAGSHTSITLPVWHSAAQEKTTRMIVHFYKIVLSALRKMCHGSQVCISGNSAIFCERWSPPSLKNRKWRCREIARMTRWKEQTRCRSLCVSAHKWPFHIKSTRHPGHTHTSMVARTHMQAYTKKCAYVTHTLQEGVCHWGKGAIPKWSAIGYLANQASDAFQQP